MTERMSCIQHAAESVFLILHDDYLAICEENHCAAKLMAIFEGWHNSKLKKAPQAVINTALVENEGMISEQSASLWIHLSKEEMRNALLDSYAETEITKALKLIVAWGYVSSRNNPLCKWDRTFQYLFHPEVVQEAILQKYDPTSRKTTVKAVKPQSEPTGAQNNGIDPVKKPDGIGEMKAAIPLIDPLIQQEIEEPAPPVRPVAPPQGTALPSQPKKTTRQESRNGSAVVFQGSEDKEPSKGKTRAIEIDPGLEGLIGSQFKKYSPLTVEQRLVLQPEIEQFNVDPVWEAFCRERIPTYFYPAKGDRPKIPYKKDDMVKSIQAKEGWKQYEIDHHPEVKDYSGWTTADFLAMTGT